MSLKIKLILIIFSYFTVACGESSSASTSTGPYKATGYIEPTIYYKPIVSLDSPCRDKEGRTPIWVQSGPQAQPSVQGHFCISDYDNCLMQGSCAVRRKDKDTIGINYTRTDSANRRIFSLISMEHCPYGYGIRNSCLDPFYTLAADLEKHPFGTVIYIPKVKGTALPNGEVHSGYFIVRDIGGGIKGRGRFDFFTGYLSPWNAKNPFKPLKLGDHSTNYEYQIISGEAADQVKASRGFPGLKDSMKSSETKKALGSP